MATISSTTDTITTASNETLVINKTDSGIQIYKQK